MTPPTSSKTDEILLKVPRKIALKVMEMAIRSGNKNIRIEIIE
jgi:hypothetical protein